MSRVGRLAYTPTGTPILEFTLAVPQVHFDKRSFGNFEVLLVGDQAEEAAAVLKIGRKLTVAGQLWTRSYVNRKSIRVTEVKILGESLEEETRPSVPEKKRMGVITHDEKA